MNKQRKIVITTTYNEMGIIIDTKVEEVAQQNLQSIFNQLATDTISRQAAIDEGMSYINGDCFCDKEDFAKYIEFIEQLPPIQPKRGKWESVSHKRARVCSCCGHDEPYKFADDDTPIYNFCPNCGADMRGEQDG